VPSKVSEKERCIKLEESNPEDRLANKVIPQKESTSGDTGNDNDKLTIVLCRRGTLDNYRESWSSRMDGTGLGDTALNLMLC
jgi:hypothetical protein